MAGSDSQWPAGIRTPDRKLRVFVSSTLGKLDTERKAARAAIEQLQLAPVMFESGARPHGRRLHRRVRRVIAMVLASRDVTA
jgi:hypothetical protein